MIRSNKGECVISGKQVDIAIEYAHITEQMLDMSPEIVIATISNFSDDVDKAIPTIFPFNIKIANDIVKAFKETSDEDKHSHS